MTVGELIEKLSDHDPEVEVKARSQSNEIFDFDGHIWQWDNSVDPPKLNTYLTIEIIEK